jgi:GNAT superfamily N-acetyltransferase
MMLSAAQLDDLLALYDHDERFAATYPYAAREEVGNVVRVLDLAANEGSVIYSRLDEVSVDAAIDDQVAYFGARGMEFEWKAYGHDRPADLIQRLAARGFEVDEPEAILVLDLHVSQPRLLGLATPNVKLVEHPDQLEAVASVRHQVYGARVSQSTNRLRLEMEYDRGYLSVHVAFVDGAPVSCGWTRFPNDSAFASLWGGATVPSRRGQGFYTSVLAARVREAHERGARYLTVDARSTSRPILERHGFQRLATATACTKLP